MCQGLRLICHRYGDAEEFLGQILLARYNCCSGKRLIKISHKKLRTAIGAESEVSAVTAANVAGLIT